MASDNLFVVLVCIFSMADDIEHIFMCFFDEVPFQIWWLFLLNYFFSYYWVLRALYIFQIQIVDS